MRRRAPKSGNWRKSAWKNWWERTADDLPPRTLFLNREEALAAILIDLKGYRPQKRLFLRLCPLAFGEGTVVTEDTKGGGVWLAGPRQRRMRRIPWPELGERIRAALERAPPTVEHLERLCALVFASPVRPAREDGVDGIRIETGMEDFRCRQCGRCCRSLDYHDQLTHDDYRAWRELGRADILERVGVVRDRGRVTGYRIWIDPATRRPAPSCPWLVRLPSTDRWICRIHDIKPDICRQYPGTRKHARMTGCIGFGASR